MKIKTGQAILIGLPIVVGVILIIRQFTKPKAPKIPENTGVIEPIITGGGGSGSGGGSSRNDKFPLKKGSYGNNVRRLQTALLKNNPSALPKYGVDGDFGNETEAALMMQTGKTTCTEAELTNLELKGAQATGTWFPPMALPQSEPNPNNPNPFLFGNQWK